MNCSQQICDLVAYNGALNIAHWRADTKSNEHNAIGALYDEMVELTDKLAEIYMGKYGVIDSVSCELPVLDNVPACGLTIVEGLQSQFDETEDSDILNVLADMSAILNKTAYLLKTEPEDSGEPVAEQESESTEKETEEFDTEGMPE